MLSTQLTKKIQAKSKPEYSQDIELIKFPEKLVTMLHYNYNPKFLLNMPRRLFFSISFILKFKVV